MIRISIIIPIYNVEQYIYKCMASIYKQGFQESDFEIIVVDDESPDGSLHIAKQMAESHTNIKIISQKNKGLGGARNTGIQRAQGQYLLFLDSDDYLLPNVLQQIIDVATKSDLDILEFGCQGVLPHGAISYQVAKSTNGVIYSGIDYYNALKYMNSACNKLYKRELLQSHAILFIENIYIEDFEFNTRAFYYAEKVMGIKNIVAHYLQSPDSITRNTSKAKKEKMVNDLIKVLQLTKEFSIQAQKRDATKIYFDTRLSFVNINIFYQLFKNNSSYSNIIKVKKQLKKEGLFHVKTPVSEINKDIFRICMLQHFWIFKITQPLKKYFLNNI